MAVFTMLFILQIALTWVVARAINAVLGMPALIVTLGVLGTIGWWFRFRWLEPRFRKSALTWLEPAAEHVWIREFRPLRQVARRVIYVFRLVVPVLQRLSGP